MITGHTPPDIYSLGPQYLANRSLVRYQGQQERVAIDVLAPEDRDRLRRSYSILIALHDPLRAVYSDASACRTILDGFVASDDYCELTDAMSKLGDDTARRLSRDDAQRVVHDLRGGAYQALSFRLEMFAEMPEEATSLQGVYFLLRDHLKIMRNCVADLDPERFADDASRKDHDVNLLVEKWSQSEFHAVQHPVRVDMRCEYHGTLCESCLEFSSLDRIIYNLMNNAARFAADDRILFCIAGVPTAEPEVVRFVVANKVAEEHLAVLRQKFGDSPGELFRGGFTTGGHGVGIRICADFCGHAFGISDFDEAYRGGYFGARWINDMLAFWFHWPIVAH
jgi:hypothetical protein